MMRYKKNRLKNKNWHLGVEIPDFGAFQPAIAVIFRVESEFAVQNARCLRSNPEIKEIYPKKNSEKWKSLGNPRNSGI